MKPRPYPAVLAFIFLLCSCRHNLSQPDTTVATYPRATNAGSNPTTITVDENTYYQPIDGFGYCLTGGSAGMGGVQGEPMRCVLLTIIKTVYYEKNSHNENACRHRTGSRDASPIHFL